MIDAKIVSQTEPDAAVLDSVATAAYLAVGGCESAPSSSGEKSVVIVTRKDNDKVGESDIAFKDEELLRRKHLARTSKRLWPCMRTKAMS